MRVAAAIILSLTGATTCFLAVSQMLDASEGIRSGAQSSATPRIAGFAAPAIASARLPAEAILADNGFEAATLPTFVPAERLRSTALAAATATSGASRPVRSAMVPPMARRIPKDPGMAETVAAAASPAAAATAAPPVAVAGQKPPSKPQRTIASRPFDDTPRSALGGPRPSAK